MDTHQWGLIRDNDVWNTPSKRLSAREELLQKLATRNIFPVIRSFNMDYTNIMEAIIKNLLQNLCKYSSRDRAYGGPYRTCGFFNCDFFLMQCVFMFNYDFFILIFLLKIQYDFSFEFN
jgi:hypothetical protein